MSARSRTTGLALKAMPSPAAASMSRSLAPSPTATTCDRGIPSASAIDFRNWALPWPVDELTGQLTGENPVDVHQCVGQGVVDPEIGSDARW